MRVVISGYYGFDNLGDEAVLAAMLDALRVRIPGAEFTVLSGNPPKTSQVHRVHSVARTSLRAIRALGEAGLFLSGGGSLIQDVTSARSAVYYLGILGLATARAQRTMVYAQGVGPLRRGWVRRLTGGVFERADLLTVRDADSQSLLTELGVRKPIHVVADPAFALNPSPQERAEEILQDIPRPRLGVALRAWGDMAYLDVLLPELRTFCDRTRTTVVVLAFHPARDLPVCRRAASVLRGHVITDLPPHEMMAVIGALDLLVGMRLHALISALAMGVPLVGLSYDPKVDALFRRLEESQQLSLSNLLPETVQATLARAWNSREETRNKLLRQAAALRENALRAADLAAELAAAPPNMRKAASP